ncbi:MAG: hypothetical protein ABFD49_03845 [Armatimonadota bacterium]|nr:hypothetical protein [bacterium]
MSIRTVKVCEECGRQTTDGENWLVMSSIEIRQAGTREDVVCSHIDLDFCSPGCLLRYVSRGLEQGHQVGKCGDLQKLEAAGRAA